MSEAVPTALVSRADVARCLGYIRELSTSIGDTARSLTPTAWAGPTNCPPWRVRDIVAHLVTSGDGFRQSVERGLAGIIEPPSSADRERWQAELVASEPGAVADALDGVTDRFEKLLGGLDEAGLSAVAFHRRGNRPARWFAPHRLAEVSFHGWDIQTSLGQTPVFDEGVAVLLLPTLLISNAPRTYAAGLSAERGTGERYLLAVADDPAARWLITIQPDRLDAAPADAAATADATLTAPASALALLAYGRRSMADLEQSGTLRIDGDPAIAARFPTVFPRP
jgi:uncharacterized protein (TIGR03083 family)